MNTELVKTEETLEKIFFSRYRKLHPAFADANTLDFIATDGKRIKAESFEEMPDLDEMNVLYLVNCGDDFLSRIESLKSYGWSIDHSYVYADDSDIASARISRNQRTVIIEKIEGAYFKECHSVNEAFESYRSLETIIATNPIGERFKLLVNSLNTGLELLRVCLPQAQTFHRQSDEVIDLLKKNDHQNRIEIFPNDQKKITEVYLFDRTFSYAYCASSDMPIGQPVFDDLAEYDQWSVGWFCVDFTIPDDWSHIGIIPVHNEEKRWFWPSEAGATFQNVWVSAPELQAAYVNGWQFKIKHRLLWPSKNKRPLDNWRNHIIRMRDEETRNLENPIRSHVRAALRDMCLKAIGKMASVKDEDIYLMSEDQFADEFEDFDRETRASVERLDNGQVSIRKKKIKSSFREMFTHPEWSSYIWSRNRAVITKLMLQIPRNQLIACRVDGIYTTDRDFLTRLKHTQQFRLKGEYKGKAIKYPESVSDLNVLKEVIE
jgi:hypothetical protein